MINHHLRLHSVLVLFLLVFGFQITSDAQGLKKFSGDSTKFIGELNSLFQTLADNDQKSVEKVMVGFIQKWNSEQYTPFQKREIYSIGDQMLNKRLKPFPDFYNLIIALNLVKESHQPDDRFQEWLSIMKKLIGTKNSRAFITFLDSSIPLFEENLVYKSQSTRWKVTTTNFHFGMDSVPFITFGKTDLIAHSNDDSIYIMHTKGVYYPLTNKWNGSEGRVDWRRAGLDPAQVYATLNTYSIPMRFSKFVADSVEFFHKKYFSSSLLGRFTDKAQADISEQLASYPAFDSYDKHIGIPSIFKNIDFYGGFAMEGAKIVGTGSAEKSAMLILKRDEKEFLLITSRTFIIRPDRINASSATATIYYENDSIFHPNIQMKYMDEKKELTLTKDEQMRVFSPWYDTFHRIEIYCEQLAWTMGTPVIDFGMMRGPSQEGKAVFESSNYYTLARYDKLQGIDEFNPLAVIKDFCDKKKKRDFSIDELCTFMRRPQEQVEAQLINLSGRGLVVYDVVKKRAKVTQKLIDYVNAKNNKTDYDVIFFNSEVSRKSNAILTLDSFDLRIQGVRSIFLSDSQQVYIYPSKQEIILQKNRNFHFGGKVEAGLFDIYTKSGYFEYDKFKLTLPNVDSMGFYVASRTIDPKTGRPSLVKVKTYITELNGDLLIDKPNNKAGLKVFPEYPIFISKQDATVNWDRKAIQNGVYKKESFYYKVYPFTFKGVSRFPTDSLKFRGYLSSAGIFPDIEQPLNVRPDYSLGIDAKTDSAGYPIYGGKGRFYNRVEMSNEGFRGDGRLVYLNSVTKSNDFIFYPDSMKALAKQFDVTEVLAAVEYPAVHGDSVNQFWLPYQDSLAISNAKMSKGKEMAMYNDQAKFKGELVMSPRGITGEGTIKIKDAEMDSKKFQFKKKEFDANIANFRIKSYNLADLSISTKNYQTHFDFEKRKGEFKSNVGISKVEFPLNRYKCSMDRFDWLIDNEEIALYNETNQKSSAADTMSLANLINFDYPGSEFVSLHPLQDSLRFHAQRATYNLRTNVINAEDVKLIKVADAAIFPDSGKVVILKNAEMKQLNRAVVIADQQRKYHQFYNATVTIPSRQKYWAAGNYDYVDRLGTHYPIRFTKITVDTTGRSYAQGSIPDSSEFKLSPEFEYKGAVELTANEKNLTFNGGFRPLSDCFKYNRWWVKFTAKIDPNNIQLPLSKPLSDLNNEKLLVGMAYNIPETKVYPAFFSKKIGYSDTVLVAADGYLSYDEKIGHYKVNMPDSARKNGEIYNSLDLVNDQCLMHFDGKINLGMNAPQLKMEAFGGLNCFVIPDSINTRVALAFDFPFPEAASDKFAMEVQSVNLEGVPIPSSPYYQAMKIVMGQKEFDKQKSDLELLGKFKKFPAELTRSLFLADVKMRWDSVTQSWVSYGPIGIGNIADKQMNRYVNGIIEFTKKRNGDDFTIYLELTKNDWYFFNFRNNDLQTISSNLTYNDVITTQQKSGSEWKKFGDIYKNYKVVISTDRKKRDFLRKFETEE